MGCKESKDMDGLMNLMMILNAIFTELFYRER